MAVDSDLLFGADLRLLGSVEYAEQRERGSDLYVAPRLQVGADAGSGTPSAKDLQRLQGVQNLQQALVVRFLTQLGDLGHLGHPTYGTRLHELVGEPNTDTTRNRARLFALQAFQAEPRIAQVRSVGVETDRRRPNRIEIKADLVAIDAATPLNFVFGFDLAGGST